MSISDHKEYIDTFCKDFKSTLTKMIENGITERQKSDFTNPLHKECVQHARFAQDRCQLFHGRKDLLNNLKEKAKNSKYAPIVIPLFSKS